MTFYALSVDIRETCVGWVIPKESREFFIDVMVNVSHRYGYAVVDSLEQAKKNDYTICVEYLACIRA